MHWKGKRGSSFLDSVLGNIFFGLALLDFPYCLLFSIFRWVHHVIAELV